MMTDGINLYGRGDTDSHMSNESNTLKGAFPFRLGTTSYIIPDDILPNVAFLADKVDDVELVLFESDELANIPSASTVRRLAALASEHRLTFTVHLPLDIHTGSVEEARRQLSVEKCLRIMDRAAPLDPVSYILHLDGDRRGGVPSADIPRWLANHRRSLAELLGHVPAERLSIETLDYPIALIAGIIAELGLSVCSDIGHLLLYGYDVQAHLDLHLARTRVIHLHGIDNGKDHRAITHLEPMFLADLLRRLTGEDPFRGVLTLEIFGEDDLQRSLQALQRNFESAAGRSLSGTQH